MQIPDYLLKLLGSTSFHKWQGLKFLFFLISSYFLSHSFSYFYRSLCEIKMQDRDKNARCEMENARCEIKNAKCEIKNARCEIENASCEIGNARCEIKM